MRVVNYTDLRKNLQGYMDAVYRDRQPLVVTRSNDEHVVMLSIDEYRSLAETEYLLSNEANARHLRDSLREARNGGARPRELRAPSSNGPTVFDAGSNYHCHPSLPD